MERKRRLTNKRFFGAWAVIALVLALAAPAWAQTGCPVPKTNWIPNNLQYISQDVANQVIDPANFSFAVFADNRDDGGRFSTLLQKVDADLAITFALNLGDLVNHGYPCSPDLYTPFFNQVDANFSLPLLTAVGNHELASDPAVGRERYQEIFGPFYYSFQIGNAYFIVVDDAGGSVAEPQWSWLKGELQKAQTFKNRFVFLHIPLYDPRPDGTHCLPKTEGDKLLALFKQYKVTHVFAGHIHDYYTGRWGGKKGVPYTITGGAGVALFSPAHYPHHHYVKVRVQNGAVTMSVQNIN